MAGMLVRRRPQRQLSVFRRTDRALTALNVVQIKEYQNSAKRSYDLAFTAPNEDSDDDEEFDCHAWHGMQAQRQAQMAQYTVQSPQPQVDPVAFDIDGLDPQHW